MSIPVWILGLAVFFAAAYAVARMVRVPDLRELTVIPEAPEPPALVLVLPGDTLWLLARKHLGDPRRYMEIAELNRITDPRRLSAGMELRMPRP